MNKDQEILDVSFLEGALNSSEVNGAWKECLDGYDELDSVAKIECLKIVLALRDQLIEILKDVNSPEERQVCLGLFYVRLKSEWMLLNTQYTYQLDMNRVRHQVVCLAGLLSSLLGAVEPYCRPEDITRIEALLAQLPNGDDQVETLQESTREAQNSQVQNLERALASRELALTRLQEEWEILEVGIGKRSAREIIELVRILKDDLLQAQRSSGNTAASERLQEFEREFGGLSARQVSQHIERLESQVKVLEEEALHWSEGQQLLLRVVGDADPVRLAARVQELQDQVTRLTIEAARRTGPTSSAPPAIQEPSDPQDLNAMLGSLESALLELTR